MFIKCRHLFLYHRQFTTAASDSASASTYSSSIIHSSCSPLFRHASPALFRANSDRRAASTSSSSASQENETLRLSNGHTLSYLTICSSSPDATSIIYLHGFPSCRFEALQMPSNSNIRIIAPDRPGLGLSTHDPDRKLLDYPSQISQLAKHLGLEQYRIIGGSGGAPYLLACAYALPRQQLKATGILAGFGPLGYGWQGTRLASPMSMHAVRYMSGVVERFLNWLAAQIPDEDFQPKALQGLLRRRLKKEDLERFERQPGGIEGLVRIVKEHFRQGPAGFLKEMQILGYQWGFKLEDIQGKKVCFWYGSQDENAPARTGTEMARRIGGSRLRIWEGEDRFELWRDHNAEIMEDIMKD